MSTLFVVYDSRCGLCTEICRWMLRQPAYVALRFIASGSPNAQYLFPGLPDGELAVVSDRGEAWVGDRAWILCLWALRRYRGWALRLARPSLLPVARQAFVALSKNRRGISRLLGLRPDEEIRAQLMEVHVPPCPIQPR